MRLPGEQFAPGGQTSCLADEPAVVSRSIHQQDRKKRRNGNRLMTIPTSEFQCVLYAVRDHVATITLNRPERRNALNPRAYAEIEAAFRAVSADDDVRVAIVTGADPSFCSGEDVKEMMTGEARPVSETRREPRPTPAAMA